MKVYKVFRWVRDWTIKDEVKFKKLYLSNRSGSTIFASEKGAKSAISQQGRYYEHNKDGFIIEEYTCEFNREIRDKYSHQGCCCDTPRLCPHVIQTDPEEYVCEKLNNQVISFCADWWEASCPCKITKED